MSRYKGKKEKCWQKIRDIVKERDGDKCYTCNKEGDEYNYDTGHYQPVAIVGSNNKKAWDIDFIRRQCKYCNSFGQGMQVEFRRKLVQELGEEKVVEYDRAVKAKEVDPVDFNKLYEELCTNKTK